MILQVARDVFS